jgi:hypothetical protein
VLARPYVHADLEPVLQARCLITHGGLLLLVTEVLEGRLRTGGNLAA